MDELSIRVKHFILKNMLIKHMEYSDLIQKPVYIKKDGFNVIESGSVVIEGIEHRINHGWVYCNLSLQNKSFNTTSKKGVCEKCFPGYKVPEKQMKCYQQKLF